MRLADPGARHSVRGEQVQNGQPLSLPSRIHLVGIGGSGLSAIARVLAMRGHQISGSDLRHSPILDDLAALGIAIHVGHAPENLGDAQMVLVSSAIPPDNPEIQEARRRGIPLLKRREVMVRLMAGQVGVAVAGTHGKTTTTAMIAFILQRMGLDPSFIVGGMAPQLGGNAHAGKGGHFIIEADEYDRMFHGLWPQVAVVTHLEMDHPDCYADMAAMRTAFEVFMDHVPKDGMIIANADSPQMVHLLAARHGRLPRPVTYGLAAAADYRIQGCHPNAAGGIDFVVSTRQGEWGRFATAVPGIHNALNAAAALLAAERCGVDRRHAGEALAAFGGVMRRFEVKGECDGVLVIDDYAHHPTEVQATLAAARLRYPARRLWVVFQPHTYSRTQTLLDVFGRCFAAADSLVVLDILAARPGERPTIHARDLAAAIRQSGSSPSLVQYLPTVEEATAYLVRVLSGGDVLLTLGAGDGYLVGEGVLARLRRRGAR